MAHGHRDFSLSGSSAVFLRARVYIVAIQAECPTPSTPLTPCHCKYLIFNGHSWLFWVLAARYPYTLPNTQGADWGVG